MTAVTKRNTEVVSISLDPATVKLLDSLTKKSGTTRSAIMAALIKKENLKTEWELLTKLGRETGKRVGITSEEDVYKFLGDA